VNEPLTFLGGFGVGLLGSVHCLGMCGGLAAALSFGLPEEQRTRTWLAVLHSCYSLGRVASYAVAGAVVGAVGLQVVEWAGPGGRIALRGLAAALMVGLGLQLGGWWPALAGLERYAARVWQRIGPLAQRLKPGRSLTGALCLGMLWGWLPCGLVYGMLGVAATSGGPASGALVMAGFGLGTMPAMLATGVLAQGLARVTRNARSRQLAGALVILFGLWTLLGSGVLRQFSSEPPPCHETHGETGPASHP
jgi:hypothetical protein